MENKSCPFNDKKHIELRKKLYLPDDKIKFIRNDKYKYVSVSSFNDSCYQPTYKQCKINIPTKEKYNEKLNSAIKRINDMDIPKEDKKTRILCITTKYTNKINNINNVLRSYKNKIELSKNQEKIIFKWFDICNYVYNRCVYYYNLDSKAFLNTHKSEFFKKIFSTLDKEAPYDILTGEYMGFKSNIKSAKSNVKNGNQTHYNMKYKNTKSGRTILIPMRAINNDGFFTNIIGKIKGFDDKINVSDIKNDCKLQYDSLTHNWYFITSQYIERKKVENKSEEVAIDEGENIFATFYSPTECGKIGVNLRKPLLRIHGEIKHLQSTINKKKNKKGKKLKNKKKLHKRIGRKYRRVTNIVNEVHHQAGNYLCQNYKRIILPLFETKKMVLKNNGKNRKEKKRNNKLNKRVKYVLLSQAHYRFKQYLKSKAEEYGTQVVDCSEEYTSQCCGKCGHLSSNYTRRIKRCPNCEHKINRDINGARNIFIMNYKFTIKK